jgi:hypothetical protein
MANLGKIRFNYRGKWQSGVAYEVDDLVAWNGAFVRCGNAHTSSSSNEPRDTIALGSDDEVLNSGDQNNNWQLMVNGMHSNSGNYSVVMDRNDSHDSVFWSTSSTHKKYAPHYNPESKYDTQFRSGWMFADQNSTRSGEWSTTANKVAYNPGTGTGETQHGSLNGTGHYNTSKKLNAYSAYGFSKYRVARRGFPNRGRIDMGYKNSTLEISNVEHSYPVNITNPTYVGHGPYFINRRGGIVQGTLSSNYSGAYGGTNDHSNDGHLVEVPFHHKDWIEGLLPTPDGEPPRAIQVEANAQGNLVLFNNGEVHYWGYGGHGQTGDGTNDSAVSGPIRCGYANQNRTGANTVLRGKRAIKIASSLNHTNNDSAISNYALIDNGNGTNTLYSWGYNGYGQLGKGNTTNYNTPQALSISTNGKIIDVWCSGGNYASVFIYTDTGYMYSCGYNGYGQLGRGSTTNQNTFGLVKNWGANGIRQLSWLGRSEMSVAVVTSGGQLWTWGRNNYYNLGHGDTSNKTSPTRVSTWTDVRAAWMSGHQNNAYCIVTRGSSSVNNTAYFVGKNTYHLAGDGGNNSTRTGWTTMTRTLWGINGQSTGNMTNVCSFRRTFGNSNGTEMGVWLGREASANLIHDTQLEDYPLNEGTGSYKTHEKYGTNTAVIDCLDHNSRGVEWYYQGYMNHGIGLGLDHDRNDYQSNIPPNHNEADGNSRRYHSNLRYPLGSNKYKLDYADIGYNTTNTSMWADYVTGQMYIAGYHEKGHTPHGQETDPWVSTIQPLGKGW